MNRSKVGTLLMLSMVAPLAATPLPTAAPLALQPASRLWVEGNSTVRKFECKAVGFEATVEAAEAQAAAAVLAGTKAVRNVEVVVPAQKLDCGNGTMNGHMAKALKASEAPTIRFRLAGYELVPAGEKATVKMNGTLSMGGTEKPISLVAEATQAGDALRVTGSKEIRMSEYGLKAPTLMMGTMKVADAVAIHYDLLLK